MIGLKGINQIEAKDDLGKLIVTGFQDNDVVIKPYDILCVASKIVSVAEERQVLLSNVQPSSEAMKIHQQVPRKDARLIQLMLNEIDDASSARLTISEGFIGARLPNGLFLTSAGVDKLDSQSAILLPRYPDQSAKRIAETITRLTSVPVSVVITDSDGRPDKKGATQVAIGVYGLTPMRSTETLCDMVAAAAGLEMGQRDAGIPVAIVSGLKYQLDTNANITDALN
ncbi:MULTISPECIES: coenzyme F420-0:L-glutamate ligase [Furfurilactobacillus]|uniref:coenzyme F420-0:L-glutamate ligase n=1 Tax=Furfurilactobacillus TaxID=2767882 RepID=UPI00326497EC